MFKYDVQATIFVQSKKRLSHSEMIKILEKKINEKNKEIEIECIGYDGNTIDDFDNPFNGKQ